MIILRNIDMELTPASIDRAIRDVERFRKDLKDAMVYLIEKLTEDGVKIAKAQLLAFDKPAFYTRQLYETIQKLPYDESTGNGAVYVENVTYYAFFVEYGTGIYNPDSTRNGEPWVYFNDRDNKWHMTRGMPKRPFMYNTLRILEDKASTEGARIIAEYIP